MSRPVDWWVLDLGADPTPGDPATITGLARDFDKVADDAETAERGVRSLASDGSVLSWLGAAGEVFQAAIGEFPSQLAQCKDSYRAGATALSTWSTDLDGAQDQADRALAAGRAARADLEAAQASLGAAQSASSSAAGTSSRVSDLAAKYADTPPPAGVVVPDPDAVRSAVRGAQVAAARVSAAQNQVGDAQTRLDAARRLALDAKDLREGRARVASSSIESASHAGIDPTSWQDKLKSFASKAWDVVVVVAKVTVAVLGIVALIIGGPLAWVVLAAAVLVMADTLAKYAKGEASGWDVGLAALGLIPGTKGLTTLGALSTAFKSGGALGASAHVLSAGKSAIVHMAARLRADSFGLRTLNVLLGNGMRRVDSAVLGRGGAVAESWLRTRTVVHRMHGGRFTAQGDLVIRRWRPDGYAGPLGQAKPANTFRTSTYDEVLLRHDTTMYRVIKEDGWARGDFWVRQKPVGSLQAQLDLALLPEWNVAEFVSGIHTEPQATHYLEAVIRRGTRTYEGVAGPQVGQRIPHSHLDGGGAQVVIQDVEKTWLAEPPVRPLVGPERPAVGPEDVDDVPGAP